MRAELQLQPVEMDKSYAPIVTDDNGQSIAPEALALISDPVARQLFELKLRKGVASESFTRPADAK